ncbi:MAG: hypothetical protein ACPHVV_01795 [Porticoccaceae bacterium]
MCRSIIFPVYLFLAGCVGLFSKPGLDFDSNRVHLVDSMNGVYFFRGNEPLIGNEKNRRFAYAELLSMMNHTLEQEGHEKLTEGSFELIDISLLNTLADEFDLKIERKFFEDNPDKGNFIHWPLYGITEIVPANETVRTVGKISLDLLYPTFLLLRTLTKIDVNRVSQHNKTIYKEVKKLHKMLQSSTEDGASTKKKVFYIHCNAGCDRTGEFVAAYRMTINKSSCSDASDKNLAECGRAQNYYSVNGTYWYCRYLRSIGLDVVCDCPEKP